MCIATPNLRRAIMLTIEYLYLKNQHDECCDHVSSTFSSGLSWYWEELVTNVRQEEENDSERCTSSRRTQCSRSYLCNISFILISQPLHVRTTKLFYLPILPMYFQIKYQHSFTILWRHFYLVGGTLEPYPEALGCLYTSLWIIHPRIPTCWSVVSGSGACFSKGLGDFYFQTLCLLVT